MSEDVYRRLQEMLDTLSIGFPATESGVEIRILKKLYTEEEAALFLNLTPALETAAALAARTGQDPEETAALLEQMTDKGTVFRLMRGDEPKYAATPFVVGSYEFQVKDLDRELSQLFEDYNEEVFRKSFNGVTSFLRPIPVNRSVDVVHPVATYDDARAFLKDQKSIALAKCICRVQQGLIDKGCDRPLEVCFNFGSAAEYYVSKGMARMISYEEAIAALELAEKAGLVCQPFNTVNPGGMCNCCGCCCGVLRALKENPKPAELVISNYFAQVDPDECTACETCLDRCQMDAIFMNDDEVAEVNLDRCIGCGLCVTTCPTEAITLQLKPEEARKMPPATAMEQMYQVAEQRGTTQALQDMFKMAMESKS